MCFIIRSKTQINTEECYELLPLTKAIHLDLYC